MELLFDPTSGSIGQVLTFLTKAISRKYDCADSNNCTAIELANIQWGSAGVTRDPPILIGPHKVTNYLPVADSVLSWWGD